MSKNLYFPLQLQFMDIKKFIKENTKLAYKHSASKKGEFLVNKYEI